MNKPDFSNPPKEAALIWENLENLRSTLEQLSWFSMSQKILIDALMVNAPPIAATIAVETLEKYAENVENSEHKKLLLEMAASYKIINETP